jgi:hypothetical protein
MSPTLCVDNKKILKIAIDNIEVKLYVMTRVIFVVDFCHLVTKNKMGCDLFKGFF